MSNEAEELKLLAALIRYTELDSILWVRENSNTLRKFVCRTFPEEIKGVLKVELTSWLPEPSERYEEYKEDWNWRVEYKDGRDVNSYHKPYNVKGIVDAIYGPKTLVVPEGTRVIREQVDMSGLTNKVSSTIDEQTTCMKMFLEEHKASSDRMAELLEHLQHRVGAVESVDKRIEQISLILDKNLKSNVKQLERGLGKKFERLGEVLGKEFEMFQESTKTALVPTEDERICLSAAAEKTAEANNMLARLKGKHYVTPLIASVSCIAMFLAGFALKGLF